MSDETSLPLDEAPPDVVPQADDTGVPVGADDEHMEQDEHPSAARQVGELLLNLALAFGFAMLIRYFVIEPFVIPTGSMIPTIQEGDQVLVNKFVYRFRDPEPGEIVVLDDPTGATPALIKRVVAVGGQTIDIKDHQVWIDGVPLDEPYTHGKPSEPGTVQMPVQLPPGTVWVMGDNRTSSADSRFIGPQPMSGVRGEAFVIYWPMARMQGF